MIDIVERLRDPLQSGYSLGNEAADEIERLRKRVEELELNHKTWVMARDLETQRANQAEARVKELDKDLAGMGGAVLSWRDAASRDREAKERAEKAYLYEKGRADTAETDLQGMRVKYEQAREITDSTVMDLTGQLRASKAALKTAEAALRECLQHADAMRLWISAHTETVHEQIASDAGALLVVLFDQWRAER